MGSRFIIVNNGMTGSRGHYFETGVSIAREAQKFGYTTAMAVHVTCDPNEIPPGLVVYPVFRIDHWGGKVAAEVPGLYGLRCSSRALRETTMDDVLAGRSSMEEYLLARFEPVPKAHASAPFRLQGSYQACGRANPPAGDGRSGPVAGSSPARVQTVLTQPCPAVALGRDARCSPEAAIAALISRSNDHRPCLARDSYRGLSRRSPATK